MAASSFRRVTPHALAMLALAGAVGRAAAQGGGLSTSLDAGTTSIDFRSIARTDLLGITPMVSGAGPWWSFSAGGTLASRDVSGAAASGMTSRGAVAGMVRALASGPVALDLGARSGWDDFAPGTTSRWWRGQARAAFDRAGHGAWLGASAGRALGDDGWHSVASASTGAWVSLGEATLRASITNQRAAGAGTYRLFAPPGSSSSDTTGNVPPDSTLVRGADAVTDGEAAVEWRHGRLALAMSVGTRFGSPTDRLWGDASATLWFSPRFALVASGGSLPASLTEFRPASRYVNVGLRFASRSEPHRPPAAAPGRGSASLPGVTVGEDDGGVRSLRVRAPGAHMVEIMGDFTNWTPIALSAATPNEWTVRVPITPGAHRMNVRVDGGPWQVPPGLAPVRDDFNGDAGLLIVQ